MSTRKLTKQDIRRIEYHCEKILEHLANIKLRCNPIVHREILEVIELCAQGTLCVKTLADKIYELIS